MDRIGGWAQNKLRSSQQFSINMCHHWSLWPHCFNRPDMQLQAWIGDSNIGWSCGVSWIWCSVKGLQGNGQSATDYFHKKNGLGWSCGPSPTDLLQRDRKDQLDLDMVVFSSTKKYYSSSFSLFILFILLIKHASQHSSTMFFLI